MAFKDMLSLMLAFVSVLLVTVHCNQGDYVYSDEYYEDESSYTTTATIVAGTAKDHFTQGYGRFNAVLSCNANSMKLTIDRTGLPDGLGLKEYVEGADRGTSFCQKTTRNSSHYVHEVSLICDSARNIVYGNDSLTYSHEIFLEILEGSNTRRPYSVIVHCTKRPSIQSTSEWKPVYRLMEHRKGIRCSKRCPHGKYCILPDDTSGYLCECSARKQEICECPNESYRCDTRGTRTIICLNDRAICDGVHDCPLKDDEICEDNVEEWGEWSQCDCESGLKARRRDCKRRLSAETSRVSRECTSAKIDLHETRNCKFHDCSRVECNADSMKIEIPFEPGMTEESVIRNMRISDANNANDCLPEVNSTHAAFTIPLHKCNTRTWVDGDVVYYSNIVHYGVDSNENAVIVREYDHSYTAKCQYERRQTISLDQFNADTNSNDELAAVAVKERHSGPARNAADTIEHYSSGDGSFEYRMEIYTDTSYSVRYHRSDYPLKTRLGERLYVEVSFLSQDQDLTVFIDRCVAVSASGDAEETSGDSSYLFIDDGCGVDATVEFHNTKSDAFSDRFSIQSFKFAEAQSPYIYFRCDVIVCDIDEDDPACQRNCDPSNSTEFTRRKRETATDFHTRNQLVQGPIVVYEGDDVFDLESQKGTVVRLEHLPALQRSGPMSDVDHRAITTENSFSIILSTVIGVLCLTLGIAVGLLLKRKLRVAKTGNTGTQQHDINGATEHEVQMALTEAC